MSNIIGTKMFCWWPHAICFYVLCPLPLSKNPEDVHSPKTSFLAATKDESCECSHDLVQRFLKKQFQFSQECESKTNQAKTNRKGWICKSIYWKKEREKKSNPKNVNLDLLWSYFPQMLRVETGKTANHFSRSIIWKRRELDFTAFGHLCSTTV